MSSQTILAAACAALALAAAAAAAPSLQAHGAEGASGVDGGSCATTVTASTTFAVSLMQATSARGRLGSTQELNASVSGGGSKEGGHLRHGFEAALAAASSLVEGGRALGRGALEQLAAAPSTLRHSLRSMAAASTGALLIFTLTFLLIVGAFAYALIFNSQMFGLQGPPQDPPKEVDSLARPRILEGARVPLTASPQPSIRGTRLSPETSARRLSLPTNPQPAVVTSRLKLAQVVGDRSAQESSNDEAVPTGASAPSVGGRPSHLEFCPDLVVPQHCECILVLPLDIGSARSSFEITDVNGSPVLRVQPQLASVGRLWKATVSTATGDTLVQCCETRLRGAATKDAEFHLLRANGAYYAKFVYNASQDQYLLTQQNNAVIRVWGNFDNSAVNITDDANRLLATTEVGPTDFDRTGAYCRLRVVPLADVGVALCGLLCIGQHRLLQRRSTP